MRPQSKAKFISQQNSPVREHKSDLIQSLVEKVWVLTNELNRQFNLTEKLILENEVMRKQLITPSVKSEQVALQYLRISSKNLKPSSTIGNSSTKTSPNPKSQQTHPQAKEHLQLGQPMQPLASDTRAKARTGTIQVRELLPQIEDPQLERLQCSHESNCCGYLKGK